VEPSYKFDELPPTLRIQRKDRNEFNTTTTSATIMKMYGAPSDPAPQTRMTGKGQKKQPPAEPDITEPDKTRTEPTITSPNATMRRSGRVFGRAKVSLSRNILEATITL